MQSGDGNVRTFHGRIMNVQCMGLGPDVPIEDSDFPTRCYAVGHREARHAAAEIACEADALLLEAVELSRSLLPILQQLVGPEAVRVRAFLARVDAL